MKTFLSFGLVALGVASAAAQPAQAASLVICDAAACGSPDPNITFSLNDFENGFSVNGSQVQIGVHSPATVPVSEEGSFLNGAAQTTFSGSWIDLGQATTTSATIFFTEHGNSVSDVLNYNYSTNGSFGTVSGYVISDVNGTLPPGQLKKLGIVATATVSEVSPFTFNNAFISASFQSDVDAVPEPSTWAMMLLGFAGLGYAGWRRGAKREAAPA